MKAEPRWVITADRNEEIKDHSNCSDQTYRGQKALVIDTQGRILTSLLIQSSSFVDFVTEMSSLTIFPLK